MIIDQYAADVDVACALVREITYRDVPSFAWFYVADHWSHFITEGE